MGDLVVVPEVEVLHEVLPVRVVPGRPVARPAPECVPALEVSLLLGLRHLAVPGGGECHIYRVSQKKRDLHLEVVLRCLEASNQKSLEG